MGTNCLFPKKTSNITSFLRALRGSDLSPQTRKTVKSTELEVKKEREAYGSSPSLAVGAMAIISLTFEARSGFVDKAMKACAFP